MVGEFKMPNILGIVSGAMLQLKEEFELDCQQQEMVVSSMLFGALIGSLTGGQLRNGLNLYTRVNLISCQWSTKYFCCKLVTIRLSTGCSKIFFTS